MGEVSGRRAWHMFDTIRETLVILAVIGLGAWVSHLIGIGCPVRFLSGISCPGCGMTRAWMAALALDWNRALAYHPLFWLVPPIVLIVSARDLVPRPLAVTFATVALLALLALWVVRLADTTDAPGLAPETTDVVGVATPAWLDALTAHAN